MRYQEFPNRQMARSHMLLQPAVNSDRYANREAVCVFVQSRRSVISLVILSRWVWQYRACYTCLISPRLALLGDSVEQEPVSWSLVIYIYMELHAKIAVMSSYILAALLELQHVVFRGMVSAQICSCYRFTLRKLVVVYLAAFSAATSQDDGKDLKEGLHVLIQVLSLIFIGGTEESLGNFE